MKAQLSKLIPAVLALCVLDAAAVTRYVDLNSPSPTPPYTNWPTAATNIQDAIDAAVVGDLVLVTNGIYQTGGRRVSGDTTTNRVAVTKAVVVQSVNGPTVTVIKGYQVPVTTNGTSAVRCVYLTNNASLIGFTLTNGATQKSPDLSEHSYLGGGIRCHSESGFLSNCIVVGNAALAGAGIVSGTSHSCAISNNIAESGGGVYSGLYIGAYSGAFNNCLISGNIAQYQGGGARGGTFNNCVFTGNIAGYGGAVDAEAGDGVLLNNCVVYGNSASSHGGGLASHGDIGRTFLWSSNCIVLSNSAPIDPNYSYLSTNEMKFDHCCVLPLPVNGVGNFVNNPLFVDPVAGDFRLQSNSPCINAGNNAYVTNATDLDGNPRIVGGTVDIGAYEILSPASMLSYAWAQQYGLPTDGSVDFTDNDGDGMNNWGEWRSDTIPTNTLSVLRMVNATNSPSGAQVTWQSVATRSYWLERATNLGSVPPFSAIASNIVGASGTKTYTDSSATNAGPYFYRVGVQ